MSPVTQYTLLVLSCLTLALLAFAGGVYLVYLSPRYAKRRRLPGWVIVWCLALYLLLPDIDLSRPDRLSRRKPAYVA
jgi:hypothetical protein